MWSYQVVEIAPLFNSQYFSTGDAATLPVFFVVLGLYVIGLGLVVIHRLVIVISLFFAVYVIGSDRLKMSRIW